MVLFPPLNFQYVENDLYRSAFPTEINYDFLRTLNLRTMLILDESCPQSLLSFMDDSNIQPIFIDNSNANLPSKWNSPIGEAMVIKALEVLMQIEHYPVLITDKHGRTLSGTVVACMRKLQGWSQMSIFEEFRRYGGYKPQQRHEEFIESFDIELVSEPTEETPFFLRLQSNHK